MRLKLKLGNHLIRFRTDKLIPNTIGIQSRCPNKMHVLFLDFDHTTLDTIITKCKSIQETYQLGNFYIFKSSKNNFHAMCIDIITFGEAAQIQDEMSMHKYINFSIKRGYWVLRISKKGTKDEPKLITIVENNSFNIKSYAHWKYLNIIHKVPSVENLSNNNRLFYDNYTAARA